jgi:hypothetical protein
MSEKQYGIIREQGEFNEFVPVNDDENKQLNRTDDKEEKDKDTK